MPGPSYSSRFYHPKNIGCILFVNASSGLVLATLCTISILPREAVLVILVTVSSFSTQQTTDDFGTEAKALSLRRGRHCKCCYVGAWRGQKQEDQYPPTAHLFEYIGKYLVYFYDAL